MTTRLDILPCDLFSYIASFLDHYEKAILWEFDRSKNDLILNEGEMNPDQEKSQEQEAILWLAEQESQSLYENSFDYLD